MCCVKICAGIWRVGEVSKVRTSSGVYTGVVVATGETSIQLESHR